MPQFQKMELIELAVLLMAFVNMTEAVGGGNRRNVANYGSSANYGARGTSFVPFGSGSSAKYGEGSFTSDGSSETASSRRLSKGFDHNVVPQPYSFDYQSDDKQGNRHHHKEEADSSGTVRGSYGYTDVQGLYRVVDYIADASGFRASIRTNEPGTDGRVNPADVQMAVQQPPFGIQERYTPFGKSLGFTRTSSGGPVVAVQSDYGSSVVGAYKTGTDESPEENDEYN